MIKKHIFSKTAEHLVWFMSVLGQIVKFDQIPNTEYDRILKMHGILSTKYIWFLKNDRIQMPNSAIQTQVFE